MTPSSVAHRDGSESPQTYFRRTKPKWMVLIAVGMGLYTWVIVSPGTFPYNYLGTVGTFLKDHRTVAQIGYVLAWLLHAAETLYAAKLLKTKGITDGLTQCRWLVQTMLFGMCSLSLLISYNPQRKRQ